MVSSDLLLIFNARNLSLYLFVFSKLCIKMQVGRCISFHLRSLKILVIIITTPYGYNTEKCPFLVSVHPSKSTETMSKCLRLEASIVNCDWFCSKNYIFIFTMFLI